MPTLVNITATTPEAIQVWGFHGPCKTSDVAAAVTTIASKLTGTDHKLHIMSGTHGYCSGQVGAVASRDSRFATADGALIAPKTVDGETVSLVVHDFNTAALDPTPDYVTAAMSLLNTAMRSVVTEEASKATFLLAYCCSAGTE